MRFAKPIEPPTSLWAIAKDNILALRADLEVFDRQHGPAGARIQYIGDKLEGAQDAEADREWRAELADALDAWRAAREPIVRGIIDMVTTLAVVFPAQPIIVMGPTPTAGELMMIWLARGTLV